MSSIRKDSFVRATTPAGPVYGKVLSVKGGTLFLATDGGTAARVLKSDAEKITAADYRAAAGATSETFDKVDAAATSVVRPKVTVDTSSVVITDAVPGARAGGVRRPGAKDTGKKAIARTVFTRLTVDGTIPTRKAFLDAMSAEAGLSNKGASTYYYHLKSGRWTA